MQTWSCKVSLSSRISIQAALEKIKVKLDLLTDMDMLLMVEKGIRGIICHSITLFIDMQKLITNTWNTMIKTKNRHIFYIGM